MIAEYKPTTGDWNDYVYANGKRVVQAANYEDGILMQGTNTTGPGEWAIYGLNIIDPETGTAPVVRDGDKLIFREIESSNARGGMAFNFTDGSSTNWVATDQNGNYANADPSGSGAWHRRSVSLSAYASKTIFNTFVTMSEQTTAGAWWMVLADVAIVHADGTVIPIYVGQGSQSFTGPVKSSGMTSLSIGNRHLSGDFVAETPAVSTVFYHGDHLGSSRMLTNYFGYPVWSGTFLPFGAEYNPQPTANHYKFTGKERDSESGLDNFGARYDASSLGRFMTPDPGNASVHRINPQSWNAYAYVNNRPLALIDPNGLEPVKAQAGTIHGFAQNMNSTPHKVGLATGSAATSALRSLGETENFGPKNTAVFNMSANRYVYTASGGWVDMVHFVFYAGRAAEYKAQGNSNPVGSAVQDGYWQERADTFKAPWSAYSYEDLPSDLYGATFGAEFFDPTSSLTLAEQIEAFLSYLSPMAPTSAPNYAALPNVDSRKPPMARNHSTVPMYTLWSTPQPKACVEAHDSSGQGTGTHCE